MTGSTQQVVLPNNKLNVDSDLLKPCPPLSDLPERALTTTDLKYWIEDRIKYLWCKDTKEDLIKAITILVERGEAEQKHKRYLLDMARSR